MIIEKNDLVNPGKIYFTTVENKSFINIQFQILFNATKNKRVISGSNIQSVLY